MKIFGSMRSGISQRTISQGLFLGSVLVLLATHAVLSTMSVSGLGGEICSEERPADHGQPTAKKKSRNTPPNSDVTEDRRQAAFRALTEAEQLRQQWTLKSFRKAIEKYQQALLRWQALGVRSQEAAALKNIGDIQELLSEHEKALSSYGTALALFEATKDGKLQSRTLSAIGRVHLAKGENHKALESCTHALQGSRATGDSWGAAEALHCMGHAHWSFNDIPRATQLLNQALDLRRSVHDRRGEANTLLLLGYTHHLRKEMGQAQGLYEESLELCKDVGDLQCQAGALLDLGHLFSLKGERQEALGFYDQCRSLFQRIGDRTGENSALFGIADLYFGMGDQERATDCYQQALEISRKLQDAEGEAIALRHLGEIHRKLGNLEESLRRSQQAIVIYRRISAVLGESRATSELGKVYEAQGKSEKALEYYTRALELCRKGGDPFHEGYLLNALGHLYQRIDQPAKAEEYYLRALALQREVKDSVGEPGTLFDLARFEAERNLFDEASAHIGIALSIHESLRAKVASRDLRSSYFASVSQHYDLYVDLLMRMHQERQSSDLNAAAFKATERARARSLLESLAEGKAHIRQGVDPELLERERSFEQQLNAKADQQTRLLSNPHKQAEADVVAKEIRNLTSEYELLQGHIRSKSPRYAALMQPQPLGLLEIQQQVLDEETLLLEYALGDERSYLWAVTKDAMVSHTLPKRAEIEKMARGVYELLTARQPKLGETTQQHQARLTRADAQYCQKASLLSETLLGPVADHLGTKRLLVVADGALQYLPFGALPVPEGQGQRVKAKEAPFTPLILEHEIVSLPSASVMAVLRRETQQRQAPAKTVAVLADPVFETDDPRLAPEVVARLRAEQVKKSKSKVNGTGQPKPSSFFLPPSPRTDPVTQSLSTPPPGLHRTLRDVGVLRDGLSFSRLLFSGREAEAVMAVTPPGQRMMATGFNANRALAISPELSQYRIVHFATHGVLNDQHPGLSGVILSLLDEQGRPQDGFLRLHDIYNLKLPADLVVLSACNTALGKDVRGEGLVGIVRGFMYAGAARVVASLWKVDDEATAELMKRFYRHMLHENVPAAAALRAAQLEMWQQKQWRSPYFWAAFALQGEWR